MANLSCGIVGLPNVGKSTLFNALTKKITAAADNYPFCTIEPNVGTVPLIDPRLDKLAKMSNSEKIVYATICFVDIAGLVKGASQGEGLGNKFLSHIRESDAIVEVIRCFDDPNIAHVAEFVDPIRDVETIDLELILADLQMVEKILEKLSKQIKGNPKLKPTKEIIEKAYSHLNQSLPLRSFAFSEEEEKVISLYPFLTRKKIFYAANVSEKDLPSMDNLYVQKLKERAEREKCPLIPICARIEEELVQLPPEEAQEYLLSLGLKESGLDRLAKAAFSLLDLITFLTTGEMETRAWTIPKGTNAAQAAGKIHSDIEKGFIRAEVVSYNEMITYNGIVEARKAGKVRIEGRGYEVVDGDVIHFFHN